MMAPFHQPEAILCTPRQRKISASVTLSALSHAVAEQQGAVILGGNDTSGWMNGWTIWGVRPREVFECGLEETNPFTKLHRHINRYRSLRDDMDFPCPFVGGWIGFFSYDLGRAIEPIAPLADDDLRTPLIRLAFYDRIIAYDHNDKIYWLVALELSDDSVSATEKLKELTTLIKGAESKTSLSFYDHERRKDTNDTFENFPCNMTASDYFRSIDHIQQHIYDGDIYQINFSQRFSCPFSALPIDLFDWQNRYNPSPFSAFLHADKLVIVSASPELFLSVRHGRITTRPIKGTRRRYDSGPDAEKINCVNFRDLVESEKEQAELNMIVDLERNDLARICVPGTRRVMKPRTIEEYPTVFHALATIEGELACIHSDTWLCDILKATFPGGSITGAPKIRAMELIETLEPTRRGVYTGSIGWIGLDRSLCLNIAIRTIFIKNQTAYVQTGGGIVADSDPAAEYEETLTKARALLEGITVVEKTAMQRQDRKRRVCNAGKSIPHSKRSKMMRK
ncbi:MAG: anthranilate synthase component I family protein [Sedimentisphaerales bacterium]|nr:anthranilate synthase component I family protein [Sedimentisphaerales bacterium]